MAIYDGNGNQVYSPNNPPSVENAPWELIYNNITSGDSDLSDGEVDVGDVAFGYEYLVYWYLANSGSKNYGCSHIFFPPSPEIVTSVPDKFELMYTSAGSSESIKIYITNGRCVFSTGNYDFRAIYRRPGNFA